MNLSSLEKAHVKPELSTQLGRFADRLSHLDLVCFAVTCIFLASTYFYFGPPGETLASSGKVERVSFYDAVYFSLVTFSSLGYGDISPVGVGRIFAVILAVCGLLTVALFIGKIASERSITILHLVHRSDVQRRLSEFREDLEGSQEAITEYLIAKKDSNLCDAVADLADKQQAMMKFLIFHANQSSALTNGNDGALSALFMTMYEVAETSAKALEYGHSTELRSITKKSELIVGRMSWLVLFLNKCYSEQCMERSYVIRFIRFLVFGPTKPQVLNAGIKIDRKFATLKARIDRWNLVKITHHTLDEVMKHAPDRVLANWPSGYSKEIAKLIGTSNGRVSRHIDELIARGHLRKLAPVS